MTRSELIKDLKQTFNSSFITKEELKEYMGYKCIDSVRKYFDGLHHCGNRYSILDVADKVMEDMFND